MFEFHERVLHERLERAAMLFPIVVLVGARQVGKSTLLQNMLGENVQQFVFDPVDDLYGARSDPDLFLDQYPAPLLLDEIQYAPELLPAIKRRVDRTPGRKGLYFLSGSQNLSVLTDVAESMAGRAGIIELQALSLTEWEQVASSSEEDSWLSRWLSGSDSFPRKFPSRLAPSSTLAERLWRGLLPGLLHVEDIRDTSEFLRSYVMTYIERDVRRAGNIQELETFRRFMGLVAALTAQEINFSQIGRDIGITRATAHKWLSLLSATYQWQSIPPYHGNAIKRMSGHHKGYLHDTGMICFLQRISSPEALMVSPLFGSVFESFVAMDILKRIAAMRTQPACYHWRTHGGAEVDLVLELDGQLWPFEFKAGTKISGHDTGGIKAFRKTYPKSSPTPAAILAPVEAPRHLGEDIWVLPYDLI